MSMEININCDLGEKSKHHSNKYDPDLLEIVNSANVACGYHAGDEQTMSQVVKISKKNVSLYIFRIFREAPTRGFRAEFRAVSSNDSGIF